MNQSFSKIWIVIILIVLLAGGISAWQYFGASRKEVKGPEIKTSEEIVQNETATWQTYRNEEYGFEVKYPENISFEEFSQGVILSVSERECDFTPSHKCPDFMIVTPIYLPSSSQIGPEESLERLLEVSLNIPRSIPRFEEFISEEQYDLDAIQKVIFGGNIQGYMIHRWFQSTGKCSYFGKSNEKSVEISRSAVGLTYLECEDDTLFNSILSTFRFVGK